MVTSQRVCMGIAKLGLRLRSDTAITNSANSYIHLQAPEYCGYDYSYCIDMDTNCRMQVFNFQNYTLVNCDLIGDGYWPP